MLVYTKKPTSEQYNYVCSKLIETYPNLRDDIGSSGYVSYLLDCYVHTVITSQSM